MNHFIVGIRSRPARWGFFVSAGVVLLAIASQLWWRSHLESNWTSIKGEEQRDLANLVHTRFNERILVQRILAREICNDATIRLALEDRSPSELARAFEKLDGYRSDEGTTVDVTDSLGSIVLWTGRSVAGSSFDTLRWAHHREFPTVVQSGLHQFLTVSEPARQGAYYVVVSTPLETNYPVSNRFVSRQSLADELMRDAGLTIRFVPGIVPRDTAGEAAFAFPIKDGEERIVTSALIPLPTLAAEQSQADRWFDAIQSLFAGLALVFLAVAGLGFSARLKQLSSRALFFILLLWGVRLGWRAVGFPSILFGGVLFDPAVHSSPFYFGLANSLGELIISSVTLFFSVILLFQSAVNWGTSPLETRISRKPWFVGVKVAAVVLIPFAFQWVVRAYGAAIRSFVFDSTIRYQDPMSLFPSMPIILMHVNILLLTLSLLAALGAAFIVVGRMVQMIAAKQSDVARVGGVTILFLAGYGAYLLINWPPQVPFFIPLLLYALGAVFLFQIESYPAVSFVERRKGLIAAAVLALTFITAVATLEAWTRAKERERMQILAEELLRPADNWLSLVVSESLRAAAGRAADFLPSETQASRPSVDLAFSLWAQTLMSKEGYSSAVVAYDRTGKELSRFAVGLTSYEQVEILKLLFHKEEDALLVMDRKVADGTVKYYGQWQHVLGQDVQPVGTIAVIVSASQRALFRGEAPEQLRASSSGHPEDIVRRITMSEYREGSLWSTDNPVFFRGMELPPAIESELAKSQRRFIWSEQVLEGHRYDLLYAKDDYDKSRVISLGLPSLDVRWHLFSIVKNLLVYLLFACVALGAVFLWAVWSGRPLKFGFREKLIVSFAVLSIGPLLLMANYDRQLALDRLDENITSGLSQDLDLIQQRFSTSILEDDDFASGVTDDYCEAVASDLGVDFSVFEGSRLKASSRPELYRASILDSRLTGIAYVNTMELGRGFRKTQERIGDVNYFVGYRPVVVGGQIRGVLAVPALYQQQQIDKELAQRNAFVLGAYAFVLSIVIGVAVVLANRLSKPLRDLSKAAESVGEGNLDILLQPPSRDEVGDLIRSFNHMTAELKSNRQNLARAERELAWKEMAKQVAHEIKNPLTPIKLSIQHLVQAHKLGAKDFADILQRVSQTVIEQIDVLTRIASEFSNFARMPERRFERIDLNGLVTETINLFREVRGIDFKAQLTSQPVVVVGDKDELRRVFINLVRNSVQAMDQAGTIAIDLVVEHQLCTIRFADSGPGIPDEIQEKVFQPNFSTKTDGTGLGLAIARKVIEDLDGTITLKSKVGAGTIVEIRIPLRHS